MVIVLTVLSALCWSAFDVSRKALVRDTPPIPLAAAFAWAQAPVFFIWAAVTATASLPGVDYGWPGLAVLALNAGASIGFFAALRRGELSRTVPLLSLSPVFSAILGALVLDEWLETQQWLGVALVVGGALLLAWPRTPAQREGSAVGAALMVVTAALWAGTAVFDKVALQHSTMAMHAGLQTLALAAVLTTGLAATGRAQEMRSVRHRRAAFLAGVLVSTVALALQLEAVQLIAVGMMESIKRATGMVAAVALGRLFFGEALSVGKWLAVAVMAAGVWLVVS